MSKRSVTVLAAAVAAVGMFGSQASFADPSGLVVVRDAGGNLWKATCDGLTCSAFASFPGNFASEPSVYWDTNIQQYVVWGRASNNSIWRSTFSRTGVFNNNWVSIPGATPSPVGGAGGGVFQNFVSTNGSMTANPVTGTVENLASITSMDAPFDGFIECRGSGSITHNRASSVGSSFARIYISTTSAGTDTLWNFTDLPSGHPAGFTSFPFSVQRWRSVSAGTHNFYLTGESGGSNPTTTVQNTALTCVYYPYSY